MKLIYRGFGKADTKKTPFDISVTSEETLFKNNTAQNVERFLVRSPLRPVH